MLRDLLRKICSDSSIDFTCERANKMYNNIISLQHTFFCANHIEINHKFLTVVCFIQSTRLSRARIKKSDVEEMFICSGQFWVSLMAAQAQQINIQLRKTKNKSTPHNAIRSNSGRSEYFSKLGALVSSKLTEANVCGFMICIIYSTEDSRASVSTTA